MITGYVSRSHTPYMFAEVVEVAWPIDSFIPGTYNIIRTSLIMHTFN